ncbi:MAG: hypothetical protein ABJF04_01600 [Reichenbachiella sp.]|uniref:hypothetical protein n=1 Tax=Reichenbachiella sp. TaxID=2184521 RepID=UPI003264B5EE
MNFILALFLTFQSDSTTLNWERVTVDDLLTVELPSNFERTDTLGQTVFYAEANYSVITLSRVPESAIPQVDRITSSSTEELRKLYTGFQNGTIKGSQGEVVDSQDVLIDSLSARVFRTDYNNGETKFNQLILVRDKIYFATVWFNTEHLELVEIEIARYFNSFQFDVIPSNQLRPARLEDSTSYKIGELLGTIIGYALIPGTIILIVILIRRKKKK